MSFLAELAVLGVMFVAIILLDYIWLVQLTRKFIIRQFGSLVDVDKKDGKIRIKLGVGLITWFIIALGVYIFAVRSASSLSRALTYGALFGFISYAIYDLTNWTFIKNYPRKFAIVDIIWGTVLGTLLSLVGFLVMGLF